MSCEQNDTSLERIAVIGMAGRFPGAGNVRQFWENLCAGIESIRFFSVEELEAAGVARTLLDQPNYVRACAYLEDADQFDAAFFGYSRREAEWMDPQHRLFLECAWDGLEHANCCPDTFKGAIGVYAGCGLNYCLLKYIRAQSVADLADFYTTILLSDKDHLATRVAYKLNLRGPALTVQTSCSTSLVAVHLACQGLLNYECDVALAGGVSLLGQQKSGYLYQEGVTFSPDGHCRAFDAKAQGTVFGNGAAVVVLKRLSDALADGDEIDAVILGSAINNDGSGKVGYTAPGVSGQAEVISMSLALAGVHADTITYVEAHGTATPLGDPVEIAALTQAFRRQTTKTNFCAIGSLKTNLGHLGEAAGIAGLLKTVLALKHRAIPPSLHFEKPNPEIDFASSPFFVNTRLCRWIPESGPRRAGVSSFGLGGTNAHLILEEPPAQKIGPETRKACEGPWLLPLSAKSPKALAALTASYFDFLSSEEASQLDVRDVCYTASVRRTHHEYRLAVIGKDRHELAQQLAAVRPGGLAEHHLKTKKETRPCRTVFVLSGLGGQWLGMGRLLFEREPVFRQTLEQCSAAIEEFVDWSVQRELNALAGDSKLARIDVAQPMLFAMQLALAALWRSRGIEPAALVGHSMGEVAAACLAGALSLRDAASIICRRSNLLCRVRGQGTMMLVELGAKQACKAIQDCADRVALGASNGPTTSLLSGDADALEKIAVRLEAQGVTVIRMKADVAAHSPQVDSLRPDLLASLAGITPRPTTIPVYSTVTGKVRQGSEFDAAYWVDNLRQPVLFSNAIQQLLDDDFNTFIELSPHPVLLLSVEDGLRYANRKGLVLSSMRRNEDEAFVMLESLGALYSAGCPVNWNSLYATAAQPVRLPSYPWQRERYWITPNPSAPNSPGAVTPDKSGSDVLPAISHAETTGTLMDECDQPKTETERKLAAIWQEVLGVTHVRMKDSFFELGGHSLLAVRLLTRVDKHFGTRIPFSIFLLAPTISGLAARLEGGYDDLKWSPIVPIQPVGKRTAFYCVTPIMGTAFPYYGLALKLGMDQPFFALQPIGLQRGDKPMNRLEDMAAYYVKAIQAVQSHGPYHIGGWSFGAPVAFEMARLLEAQGHRVGLVALIDTPAPVSSQKPSLLQAMDFFCNTVLGNLFPYVKEFYRLAISEAYRSSPEGSKWHFWTGQIEFLLGSIPLLRVFLANGLAGARYRPKPYPGGVTLLRTETAIAKNTLDPAWGWGELAQGGVEIRRIAGNHMTLLREPHVDVIAAALKDCLDP